MSHLFLVYLVLFGYTAPSETGNVYSQVTVLQQFQNVSECKKFIEHMGLTEQQKQEVGCVRVVRGDVKLEEA